ncbi:MAG TPA: hypothetical protein VF324_00265 [Methanobacterium sp.]
MSKTLDIIMAGVIAGIVAYTTSKIGLTGTIIGSVLGAMLFQLMSHYFRDPLENVETQKVEREIFYIFPLVIILAIEVIYLLSSFYFTPDQIFHILENATGWNLFRTIGIGLIIMGIYPLLQSDSIDKEYGYIILFVGIIKLLGGFADANSSLVDIYSPIFYQLNEVIAIMVIIALSYVIFEIARKSVTIIHRKDENVNPNENINQDENIKQEKNIKR